jgi:hypothetical protein
MSGDPSPSLGPDDAIEQASIAKKCNIPFQGPTTARHLICQIFNNQFPDSAEGGFLPLG